MQDWKRAFGLAKFELRESKGSLILVLLFFLFLCSYFRSSLPSYLENGFVGYDFFFVLVFSVAAFWAKPKEFQISKINSSLQVSRLLVTQSQLPIKRDVLVKSRFIIHFFYSFPYQVLLLLLLYAFTPDLSELLPLGSYTAFSIIWLSFGIYTGYVFPMSEAGDKTGLTTAAIIAYCIVFLVITFFVFAFIHFLFGNGIVYWSIVFAQKWPLLSSVISLFLAFFGFKHWQYYMNKAMEKIDYL